MTLSKNAIQEFHLQMSGVCAWLIIHILPHYISLVRDCMYMPLVMDSWIIYILQSGTLQSAHRENTAIMLVHTVRNSS
jgi:hypothetical protein